MVIKFQTVEEEGKGIPHPMEKKFDGVGVDFE